MTEGHPRPPAILLPPRDAQDDPDTIAFFARYQKLKQLESQLGKLDSQKDRLIEDLLERYELSRSQFFDKFDELSRLKDVSDGDSYVSVILDGDCMLFHDDFLLDGAAGGVRAGKMLRDSVASHCLDIMPQLRVPEKVKVIGRVYANFRSIAETTMRANTIDSVAIVEDFARGFTQAYPSFDFIDVRFENGVAEKIFESVSHQLGDHRCKHIILGCSTTAALASYLNHLGATVPRSLDHITLLQGLPWHPDILSTLFGKVVYGSMFRTELPLQSYGSPISQPPGLSSRKTSCASAVDSGVHTPAVPPATPATTGTNTTSWAAKAKAALGRPEAPSPASRPMTPVLKKVNGKENVPPKRTTSPSAPTKDEHGILRNRNGQRVDPPAKVYNRDEVNRIKKMKLCNVHFLRPPCPYFQSCSHEHKYTPLKGELDTLRLVARMAPCQWGTECDDAECIYGHRCPAPGRKDGGMNKEARVEGKTCIFGTQCRFSGEMHD